MFNNMFGSPPMCGGTTSSQDENAPKEIVSRDMTLFKAETAITPCVSIDGTAKTAWFRFISVFAAKCSDGIFVLVNADNRNDRREFKWSLIKEDIFPALVKAAGDNDLAKSNGSHSFTYGLPENFGGEVRADYSSGERIDFSTNRSPVISIDFALWLYDFFSEAVNKEPVELPDADRIKAIRFDSKHSDGGYNHTVLTDNGDGICDFKRERKFSTPDIFSDEKTVPDEMFKKFITIVKTNAMLVWSNFPDNGSSQLNQIEEKCLTFVFDDGTEVMAPSDRFLPNQVSGAFFKIELEIGNI